MKIYQKLIAPVIYYPGQSYEPKKKYIEDPIVWYPEEMKHDLQFKYQDLNTNWNILGFDERYELFDDLPERRTYKNATD